MTGDSSRETGATDFDVKEHRFEDPSGWMRLVRYETTRFLVDALLEAPPGMAFNKSELSRRTGMSRNSIQDHVDLLVDLGVVEELDDSGWAEYRLNDAGRVTVELFELNSAVNAVLSGRSKDVEARPEPDLAHVDRSDWEAAKRVRERLEAVNGDAG